MTGAEVIRSMTPQEVEKMRRMTEIPPRGQRRVPPGGAIVIATLSTILLYGVIALIYLQVTK